MRSLLAQLQPAELGQYTEELQTSFASVSELDTVDAPWARGRSADSQDNDDDTRRKRKDKAESKEADPSVKHQTWVVNQLFACYQKPCKAGVEGGDRSPHGM